MYTPGVRLKQTIAAESDIYKVSGKVILMFSIVPILILVLFSIAWVIPETHRFATWASKENGPAELLTFVFLLFGSILGIALSIRLKTQGEKQIIWSFVALFSSAIFFVAMEEISWGQQFFQFDTPETLRAINNQNEFSFHNIKGLHGNSEYFHLLFGLAGLAAIRLNPSFLHKVKVPGLFSILMILIVAIAVFDLICDFIPFRDSVIYFTRRLSEINEMFIGFVGFSYILLHCRKFSKAYKPILKTSYETQEVKTHSGTEQIMDGVKI